LSEAPEEKINVVVAMDFSDEIIEQLRDVSPRLHVERYFPDVPEDVWADAEILYTLRNFPEVTQAPRLRWIQLHVAGIEDILDRPIVRAQDIEVTTASGVHAVQMAEFCLAMMLAFNYKIPTMLRLKSMAEWPKNPSATFHPMPLRGKTVGIVGYGSIGRELARQADALGMTVLATKRDVRHTAQQETYVIDNLGDVEGDIPERIYPPEALASMAKECDYLVVTLPLTNETTHLIDETVLEAMKPSAILINVSRGAVVDEKALITAISSEQIGGAALDVFEEEPLPKTSPLWNLEHVIISPHVSGFTDDYHQRVANLFIENLKRYLENRPLLNRLKREHGY